DGTPQPTTSARFPALLEPLPVGVYRPAGAPASRRRLCCLPPRSRGEGPAPPLCPLQEGGPLAPRPHLPAARLPPGSAGTICRGRAPAPHRRRGYPPGGGSILPPHPRDRRSLHHPRAAEVGLVVDRSRRVSRRSRCRGGAARRAASRGPSRRS